MNHPDKDRPVNKATMDAPQEEFVDDQTPPSRIEPKSDEARNAELRAKNSKEQSDPDSVPRP